MLPLEMRQTLKLTSKTLTGDSAILRRVPAASTKKVGARQTCSENASSKIRERLVEFEKKLTHLLDDVMPGGTLIGLGVKSVVSDVASTKNRLAILCNELEETKKAYEGQWPDIYRSDQNFQYYYRMEVCLYIYYLLSRLESSSTDFDSTTLFNTYYKNSLRNYFDVLKNNPYENDSLIYFRIGSVYVLGGQIDLAVQNYRKATNVLADDALLPFDSIYRSMIPRHTGYVLWVRADQLIKDGERDDNYHLKSQAAELIKDALEITFGWYRRLKEASHPALMEATEELVSYNNNILYYSAKYGELRSLESLERDCKIDKATIDTLYNSFSISDEMPLNRVDTMVHVGLSLGKDAEAKLWAKKLRSGLDNPVISDKYSKQQLELMRESVKKALGDDERPLGGEAVKYPDP